MVAFLLGLALALTMVPFPLGWLSPLPLALLLARFGGRRRALEAFWAGLGFWALHVAWLPASFELMFGPLGVVPFLPMILAEAGFWALLVWLFGNRGTALLGAWVLLDYLRAHLGALAFPWGEFGYALTASPARMLAALGGVGLLSLLVLLTAWALYRGRYWVLIPWAIAWLTPLPRPQPQRSAILVQGALNPLAKVRGASALQVYQRLTSEALEHNPQADLVVWPETAVPRLPQGLGSLVGGRDLITGVAAYDDGFRNRVVLYRGGKIVASYDKTVLVPFGEYFPYRGVFGWLYGFFLERFGMASLADTKPGKGLAPLAEYGAYICYESAFPEVARRMANEGARLLVNVSNDAWFGPTFGAQQHFEMGRLRAVETGRWLLRAGNDGVTAAIDPYGRVRRRLAKGERGWLLAGYSFSDVKTPYLYWGDWPLLLLALLLAVWGRKPRREWWR